jgi:hypothetical protein
MSPFLIFYTYIFATLKTRFWALGVSIKSPGHIPTEFFNAKPLPTSFRPFCPSSVRRPVVSIIISSILAARSRALFGTVRNPFTLFLNHFLATGIQ